MGGFRYWRMWITRAVNNETYVGIGEFELRATPGGSSIVSGGTASASSEFSATYSADKAIDADPTTLWHTISGDPKVAWWWQYHFAEPVGAAEYSLLIPSSHSAIRSPRDWELQVSDDASNWLTVDQRVGEDFVGDIERQWPLTIDAYRLTGVAKFSDGQVADNVRVWYRGNATHLNDTTPAPLTGEFSIIAATSGPYDVLITRDGYRPLAHGPVTASAI